MQASTKSILLASPRGFCAGVERAIAIVEKALARFGAPVYVRHEIVHNRHVVEGLRAQGAVFVEELEQVPDDGLVIFSAHGVSLAVQDEAARRKLRVLDATCPLVTKVHLEARRHTSAGREVVLLGHAGHPEVVGTMGQVPGGCLLVSSAEDVARLRVKDPERLAFVTQTTLSVDETEDMVNALRRRFPHIMGPNKEDICYATQNRQNAVKALARRVEVLLVLGAPNSSNANRLRELGTRCGIRSYLIESAEGIDPSWLEGVRRVGITAGASTPESLVQGVVKFLQSLGLADVEIVQEIEEDIHFPLPKGLLTA